MADKDFIARVMQFLRDVAPKLECEAENRAAGGQDTDYYKTMRRLSNRAHSLIRQADDASVVTVTVTPPSCTPAPWSVHEGEDYIVLLGPNDPTDAPIARFFHRPDADMCAATPALLAACKDALPFLEGFEDDETQEEPVDPLIDQVRAAIALAEAA